MTTTTTDHEKRALINLHLAEHNYKVAMTAATKAAQAFLDAIDGRLGPERAAGCRIVLDARLEECNLCEGKVRGCEMRVRNARRTALDLLREGIRDDARYD